MTDQAKAEREKVVAWLREEVRNNMTLAQRLSFAWRAFINPNEVVACVLGNLAISIERGDHLTNEGQ